MNCSYSRERVYAAIVPPNELIALDEQAVAARSSASIASFESAARAAGPPSRLPTGGRRTDGGASRRRGLALQAVQAQALTGARSPE